MARKYNVRKEGSPSHYPERLASRGETNASVRMPFYDEDGRTYDTFDDAMRANGRKVHNRG